MRAERYESSARSAARKATRIHSIVLRIAVHWRNITRKHKYAAALPLQSTVTTSKQSQDGSSKLGGYMANINTRGGYVSRDVNTRPLGYSSDDITNAFDMAPRPHPRPEPKRPGYITLSTSSDVNAMYIQTPRRPLLMHPTPALTDSAQFRARVDDGLPSLNLAGDEPSIESAAVPVHTIKRSHQDGEVLTTLVQPIANDRQRAIDMAAGNPHTRHDSADVVETKEQRIARLKATFADFQVLIQQRDRLRSEIIRAPTGQ